MRKGEIIDKCLREYCIEGKTLGEVLITCCEMTMNSVLDNAVLWCSDNTSWSESYISNEDVAERMVNAVKIKMEMTQNYDKD